MRIVPNTGNKSNELKSKAQLTITSLKLVILPKASLAVTRATRTCSCGLSVTVAALSVVTASVAPNWLQASVCDEQLVGIGGEIALSRNTPAPPAT